MNPWLYCTFYRNNCSHFSGKIAIPVVHFLIFPMINTWFISIYLTFTNLEKYDKFYVFLGKRQIKLQTNTKNIRILINFLKICWNEKKFSKKKHYVFQKFFQKWSNLDPFFLSTIITYCSITFLLAFMSLLQCREAFSFIFRHDIIFLYRQLFCGII